jgi:hypothetical protein
MSKDARIALRLPQELRDALDKAAAAEMRTLSQMTVVILSRALLGPTAEPQRPPSNKKPRRRPRRA